MDKKQIISSLYEIANNLDDAGLIKEANDVTNVIIKVAQIQMPQVAPISRHNQQTYGYQAAVDKWIQTNHTSVNNALQSPKPMQALAPLLMNVQPVELANAIRTKIGEMKQGLS